ncbi:hypothetical protein ESA94_19135 [Lacibacter luteus]|uniref:Peptidase C1A papain C-terminal domain-containing protein n=1 Tax=Lacibacter luteus TaxID=2508719 RepID=A0A4Q1CEX4_9BACT|nr:Ig-like domain-containing protein [Lacibacter luteus]RXK58127.1 hypothetical protein ESA94_19135 [Lacibacter luteus]
MIFFKPRTCVAAILCVTLFMVACKKEASDKSVEESSELQQVKARGLVADNPQTVSKVPLIVSADLLSKTSADPTLLIALKGKPVSTTKDATPPVISITSPSAGATVSGTVDVTVNATDNVGVTMVSLTVDNVSVSSSTSAPFTMSWNSASVTNGTHTLKVTAKDAAGNISSNTIQVNVSTVTNTDVINPVVSITSPANDASVTGTVNITATATDNKAVSTVRYSIDGTVVGSSTTAPYNFSWNTSSVVAGIHTITVTAVDAAGNTGAQSIQVTVSTTVLPPAPLPSKLTLYMPSVGYQGSEGSCVAWAVAYYARSAEAYYRSGAAGYSQSVNVFSPEFLYNQTKSSIDCSSGSSVLSVLDFVVRNGVCTWQSMPYTSGSCSLLPSSQQSSEAALYKISSYSAVLTTDITAIKTLLSQKHPLLLGVSTDQQFDNAGPGFIWSSYGPAITSLHEVTICGYDDALQAFKIVNSWGTGWGDAGYSWISYSFLSKLNNYVFTLN